jgi:ubiquinone/menaquinone biosynthesis C-methylase UbiE
MGDPIRDVFDEQATFWTTHYAENGPMLDRIARFGLVLATHSVAPTSVLDLGCGTGELAAALLKKHPLVVGADVSHQMLSVGRKRDPSVGWVQLSSTPDHWPFRVGSFDVVTASSVFEYVPDPLALLQQLDRTLRPGGILAFTVPNMRSRERKRESHIIPWIRSPLLKPILDATRWRAYAQYLRISVNRLSHEDWHSLARRAGLTLVCILDEGNPLSMMVLRKSADRA